MRIVVVIRNEEQLGTAGVRIRYLRLGHALERLGHAIELRVLGDVTLDGPFDADAYILCKCHDARAVLIARAVAAAGRPVGIDVFDDYFSQRADSRLVHLRRWLDDMRPWLGFALCATPTMAGRLATLVPGVPLHVLSDPAPPHEPEAMAQAVERKAAAARGSRRIEVAWFGVGDNPYFPVGLDDLAAWGGMLAEARSAGFSPCLSILTNRRALSPRILEDLARLPVPARIEEWSEEAEAALLARSLVAFLPVNAQPFSTPKSLNRAITTLVAGTQVLTAGYPLYRSLGRFAYRSILDLADDLAADRLRLRRETLGRLTGFLARLGDPDVEARELAALLSGPGVQGRGARAAAREARGGGEEAGRPLRAVLHGVSSGLDVATLGEDGSILSVGGLFTGSRMPDIRLDPDGPDGPSILVSERACPRLAADLRPLLGEPAKTKGGMMRRLRLADALGDEDGAEARDLLAAAGLRALSQRVALYAPATAAMRRLLERLLPGVETTLSELASPFAAAPSAPPGIVSRAEGAAAKGGAP